MCKKPPLAFLEIGKDRVVQSGFLLLFLIVIIARIENS